jgi:replicative DNA helicase
MNLDNSTAHSPSAERAVLGALLRDPSLAHELSEELVAKDFFNLGHRQVFETIVSRVASGQAVDVITVGATVRERLGEDYVAELPAAASSGEHLRSHVALIRDFSMRRMVHRAGLKIQECVLEGDAGGEQLVSRLRQVVDAVVNKGAREKSPLISYADILPGYYDEMHERLQRGDALTGIASGLRDFDKMTFGLQRQDLVIIAGRPSMGKTALAINIVENVCLAGDGALVFSMEMPAKQLLHRSISSIGRIDNQRLRSGRLTEIEKERLKQADEILRGFDIRVDDTPGLTLHELQNRAYRAHRESPLSVIVVDYIQLMQFTNPRANRAEQVGDISRGLKQLARDLDCPVIALSQLNRSLEQRPDKRPIPSDLRDSGNIEQDADVIAFVYRDEVYHPDSLDRGIGEVIIAKQRMGPIGTVRLAFLGEYSRFENLAPMNAVA